MPRPRLTPQQQREKAIRSAIARGAAELELYHDKDIANHVGFTRQQYAYHKKRNFQGIDLMQAGHFARVLHFTAYETCAIIGVPYGGEAMK